MDGASNNDTMLVKLAKLLGARDISFDPVDRRMSCFAHIVDLSSGRVLKELPGAADSTDWDEPLCLDSASQTYDDALRRNPLGLARMVVRAIRGSGLRRAAFAETISRGNDDKNNWFFIGEKSVKVPPLQLLHDVRTRWDSVYHMLNRLRELRPVCHLPELYLRYL